MSIKAYQSAQDKTIDPRRVEIMLFQKCNARLTAAAHARHGGTADPLAAVKAMEQALFENDRLWVALLCDLASDENRLSEELRARLISLGLWARRHMDAVRCGQASIEPLVELNNQMIAGLSASLESTRSTAPLPAEPPAFPTTRSAPFIT